MNSKCLNCNNPVSGKFCSECGQKADTHRITAKHFVMHDLVHGVWHIDKGILFTLKQLFTRPGFAASDYIAGKRVQYYNIFYLMFIVLGLIIVFTNANAELSVFYAGNDDEASRQAELLNSNLKIMSLFLLPVFAFAGYIIFRRLKLNFFEHLIVSGFILLGMFIMVLAGILIESYNNANYSILYYTSNLIGLMCASFPAVVYYQVTKYSYMFFGYLWRIIVFYIILVICSASLIKILSIILESLYK